MVETTFNYLADMTERPTYYTYEPPAGKPWRNTKGDRRTMSVESARQLEPAPSLDREGFQLARLETAAENLRQQRAIRETYYAEVEALVKRETGAHRVVAFDHNLRSSATREERAQNLQREPVHYAHNDYTEISGPQRVRDLFPAEADELLARRFAVINVWKPLSGPVEQAPLAVCDARTIAAEDLVPTDLLYPDRNGEVYSLRYGSKHRWFYYPRMQADEAMLLKCYDSARDRARFTAHSAFDDPTSPPNASSRESIEVRTLAFF
jgi:hypothetical protein